MIKHLSRLGTVVAFLAIGVSATAGDGIARVSLPYKQVGSIDGVKFHIQAPANWNGTLLVYMQGSKMSAPPAEPLLAPNVVDSPAVSLTSTLLARGYALAASEIGVSDWQVKETVQDTFALTVYFRATVGDPKRVILWGSSMGGMSALRLIEDYPKSYDAAIPMCASGAGWTRRMDRNLDFALAYAVVFGWPAEWGSLDDTRVGLNFARDVYPKLAAPAADGSNKGGWEFIRLVFGLPNDALYGLDPMYKLPMWLMIMMTSTQLREDTEFFAGGAFVQNAGRVYTLTSEEKAYLATLGVDAEALLAKMNARANIAGSPEARDWVRKFGDYRGKLLRPVLMLKNTLDGQAEVRHDSYYKAQVENWRSADYLSQVFVSGVGHCAFTSGQLLIALDAMEGWLNTGVKPAPASFRSADGFAPDFTPAPWRD